MEIGDRRQVGQGLGFPLYLQEIPRPGHLVGFELPLMQDRTLPETFGLPTTCLYSHAGAEPHTPDYTPHPTLPREDLVPFPVCWYSTYTGAFPFCPHSGTGLGDCWPWKDRQPPPHPSLPPFLPHMPTFPVPGAGTLTVSHPTPLSIQPPSPPCPTPFPVTVP